MIPLLPWQRRMQARPLDRRPQNIFEYKIFSYFEREREKHITGYVRKYLNDDQIQRWNYFFRPDARLLRAADEKKLADLTTALEAETRKLRPINSMIEGIVASIPNGIALAVVLSCLACVVFSFLAVVWSWWSLVPAVTAGVFSYLFLTTLPAAQIKDRIKTLNDQIMAIEEFHKGIEAQIPIITWTERNIDSFLRDAVAKLRKDEEHRLEIRRQMAGTYEGPKSETFGPIVRWALETDRKDWLDAALEPPVEKYRPPIYWVARRGSHYVRYDIQFIFLYYGQLTHYQGIFDLIQGEWIDASRRHIILANLFCVDDATSEDFSFRRTLRDRIVRAASANEFDARKGDAEEEAAPGDMGDEIRDGGAAEENRVKGESDLVDLTQRTTIRFVGSGKSLELNFVGSRQRASLIAQLRDRRKTVEAANIEAARQQANDHRNYDVATDSAQGSESASVQNAVMAELAKLREAEGIVSRTETIDNVDGFVDQILAHTRWTVGQRQFESQLD